MLRSIAALIAGYFATALIVSLMFMVVFRGQPDAMPSIGFNLFSVVWGFVAATIGGYLTCLIARRDEMKHALGLVGLSLVMWIAYVATGPEGEPLWLQIANLVAMASGILTGAKLRIARKGGATEAD